MRDPHKPIRIVGDFNPSNESHLATNRALEHCRAALNRQFNFEWLDTVRLVQPGAIRLLEASSGLWIGPGSPYHSMDGALMAIRFARERGWPVLGTCGGFQHMLLEFARNVLDFKDAAHEETHPDASRHLISRLACSLAGRTMQIHLEPDSLPARTRGRTELEEQYRCNFGVNPDYVDLLRSSALRIVASDGEGVVRAVELDDHPFFVGALFLPQHSSTPAAPHPLIVGFVRACLANDQA